MRLAGLGDLRAEDLAVMCAVHASRVLVEVVLAFGRDLANAGAGGEQRFFVIAIFQAQLIINISRFWL